MHRDISPLLKDWENEPGSPTARYVEGLDGRRKIQFRMDLGLFQMELQGRPDGSEPHGYATSLDYFQTQAHTTPKGRYKLDSEACAELQQESVQFYHRYLARMQLKDYAGVMRDTEHNLAIFDLVEKHAEDEDMAWDFLQFKPYVIMMHTRARAESLAEQQRLGPALEAIQQGLRQIREFWREQGEEDMMNDCFEISALNELKQSLKSDDRPRCESDRVRESLNQAIRMENFERAAQLRDHLRDLERKEAAGARRPVG